MNKKQSFAVIIAGLFIFAMLIYGDKMTFGEIVGAFVANGLLISTLWQWFRAEEKEVKIKSRNHIINKLTKNKEFLDKEVDRLNNYTTELRLENENIIKKIAKP